MKVVVPATFQWIKVWSSNFFIDNVSPFDNSLLHTKPFRNGSKCWYSCIYFSYNKIIPKFTEFIDYCRALEYEETPDYEHLRNMLRNRMKLKNYEFDKNFDWIENDPFQQVQGWQMYKNGDSVNNGEDHGD